jgi:hypothetical protein
MLAASLKLPPVSSATSSRLARSTGTGTVSPSMSRVPKSVPKAIVDTGTWAALAASMACVSSRPTVLKPSESSTMRAGGSSSVGTSMLVW